MRMRMSYKPVAGIGIEIDTHNSYILSHFSEAEGWGFAVPVSIYYRYRLIGLSTSLPPNDFSITLENRCV